LYYWSRESFAKTCTALQISCAQVQYIHSQPRRKCCRPNSRGMGRRELQAAWRGALGLVGLVWVCLYSSLFFCLQSLKKSQAPLESESSVLASQRSLFFLLGTMTRLLNSAISCCNLLIFSCIKAIWAV
jgi:hypothetical protein